MGKSIICQASAGCILKEFLNFELGEDLGTYMTDMDTLSKLSPGSVEDSVIFLHPMGGPAVTD